MRRHPLPKVFSVHPNVTPLIDVVMCLIIFYMLVAQIGINHGEDRTIKLPAALLGIDLTDLGNTITLNVLRPETGGQPRVTYLDAHTGTVVDIPVESDGRHVLADLLRQLKGQNSEFKVIIRADENLDYQFLE